MSTRESREKWRVFGQKLSLPESADGWKISQRPGGWCIAEKDGVRRRVLASEVGGKLSASLGGNLWHGDVQRREHQSSGGSGGSDADLVAQFPGKVRKVLVTEGETVAEGQPLLLVEAMKMEFAVKAPFAGVVKRVLVKESQQLNPGDRFVDLTEKAAKSNG